MTIIEERIAIALERIADAMEAGPSQEGIALDVPWLSQMGVSAGYAPGDCGPACGAMWLNFYGRNVTVDEMSKKTGLKPGFRYTTPGHLMLAMRSYGVNTYWRDKLVMDDLRAEIDANHPAICLVEYDYLPMRYDHSYRYGHWVLFVGYGQDERGMPQILYHDPYWNNRTGAFIVCPARSFVVAWGMNHESGNRDFQAVRIRR